jgi:DHA1 family bicyclomycin/chloramphenicol resistance-like MFS transporter
MSLRHSPYLPLLLAGVSTLAPFAIDTYLPAFHAMEGALQATPVQMQQTLSAYLAAFAVMLLFHGALSDAYGRRAVMLVNLVLFTLASIACACATDIHTFTALRVLQGCTGGAGLVVGRAIIRDLHEGPAAQRMMSQVTMWFALAPAVAPVIGGFLQAHLGWTAIFWFMAGVGGLLFLLCRALLPETLPLPGRQVFRPRPLLRSYAEVLGDRRFLLLSAALAANFSGFFLYIASAPAFVGGLLHQPETRYAWLFVPGIGGVSLGAWLSGRVARRWTAARTIRVGYAIMLTAAAGNLLGNLLRAPELPWAVAPIMLYTVGMSLTTPTVTLMLLDFFPHLRGMTASLQNCMATLLNAAVAGALSPLLSGSGLGLAAGMAVLSMAGMGFYLAYRDLRTRRTRTASS